MIFLQPFGVRVRIFTLMKAKEVLEKMIRTRRHRIATMPDPTTPTLAQEWERLVIEANVLAEAAAMIVAEEHKLPREVNYCPGDFGG